MTALDRVQGTDLDTIAADIRSEHEAAQDAFRSAVDHAVRCGQLLAEAKAQVSHGAWGAWLAEHFPASQRTAQGYMRLAAAEDAQALAHLGIEGALKQLAAAKVSDDLADPRVQHVAAEDDLRDGLRAWAAAHPDEVDIAFTAVCITYNQLAEAGAHTDFGYQDFDAYAADRLSDVEAELAALQLDRDGSAEFSQTAREVDQDDDPPAGLDHLAQAEWYIDRADAKVAAAASALLAWAEEVPEHLSDLNTAARRYAHLLLAQPEPWGELSDAKEWARQEFKDALDAAGGNES